MIFRTRIIEYTIHDPTLLGHLLSFLKNSIWLTSSHMPNSMSFGLYITLYMFCIVSWTIGQTPGKFVDAADT